MRRQCALPVLFVIVVAARGTEGGSRMDAPRPAPKPAGQEQPADGHTVKSVLRAGDKGENLLVPDGWRPWQKGFEREGRLFTCDNGADSAVQRGASQTVVLDQNGTVHHRTRGYRPGDEVILKKKIGGLLKTREEAASEPAQE